MLLKESSNAWKTEIKEHSALKLGIGAPIDHETNKIWKMKEKNVSFKLHMLEMWWQQERLILNWDEGKTREMI